MQDQGVAPTDIAATTSAASPSLHLEQQSSRVNDIAMP